MGALECFVRAVRVSKGCKGRLGYIPIRVRPSCIPSIEKSAGFGEQFGVVNSHFFARLPPSAFIVDR